MRAAMKKQTLTWWNVEVLHWQVADAEHHGCDGVEVGGGGGQGAAAAPPPTLGSSSTLVQPIEDFSWQTSFFSGRLKKVRL